MVVVAVHKINSFRVAETPTLQPPMLSRYLLSDRTTAFLVSKRQFHGPSLEYSIPNMSNPERGLRTRIFG